MERGLVSTDWLASRLASGNPKLRVVDATWFLPNSPFACPVEGSSAAAEFEKGPRLPTAGFFDLDAVADTSLDLPHMLPPAGKLATALAELGISKDSEVVVYDQLGIFSAPRFWYTLKAFGHPLVAVLDGGLPRWLEEGRHTESGVVRSGPSPAPEETWSLNPGMVWDLSRVMANIQKPEAQIVDARPAGRFTASVPEPRPGMRGGHMPGSINVPFAEVLTSERTMKQPEELAEVFNRVGLQLSPNIDATRQMPYIVSSCGSGMTACILGLALRQLDFPIETRWAVYDGSWTEYGARSDTEIVKVGPGGESVKVPPLDEPSSKL